MKFVLNLILICEIQWESVQLEFNMRAKKFPSWSHEFAALTKRKLLGLKLTNV